jgi:chromosome segregation ATPase
MTNDDSSARDPEPSDLGAAAAALDDALVRCETLAAEAGRVRLDSEKNLNRAARLLSDAAESQDQVAAHVRSLVGAVEVARRRQQENAVALAARAEELQRRVNELGELMTSFSALGQEAKDLNLLMAEVFAKKKDAAAKAELLQGLDAIHMRMTGAVTMAETITKAAADKQMVDVGRQADAIRQQIHAAKNKLELLRQTLARA